MSAARPCISPKGGRGNCCASASGSGSGHDRGGADRDAKCRNRRASRSPLVSPKISLAADDTQQRPRASPTPTSAYVPMHGRVCSCSESTAQQTSMTAVRARAGQRRRPRWGDRYRRDAIARRRPPRRFLFFSRRRAAHYRIGDQAIVRLVGGRTSFVGRLLLRAAVRAKRKCDPRVRSGDDAAVLTDVPCNRVGRPRAAVRTVRGVEQPSVP